MLLNVARRIAGRPKDKTSSIAATWDKGLITLHLKYP
jgi:hypothetical protein